MKVRNILFYTIVVLLLISGCSIETKPGEESLATVSEYGDLPSAIKENPIELKLTIDKNVYSKKEYRLTFTIDNNSSEPVYFESPVYVEKWKDDKWYQIPYTERLAFTDIVLGVEPHSQSEETIDLRNLDFQRTEGLYRITKSFHGGELDDFVLGVEFEIKD